MQDQTKKPSRKNKGRVKHVVPPLLQNATLGLLTVKSIHRLCSSFLHANMQ